MPIQWCDVDEEEEEEYCDEHGGWGRHDSIGGRFRLPESRVDRSCDVDGPRILHGFDYSLLPHLPTIVPVPREQTTTRVAIVMDDACTVDPSVSLAFLVSTFTALAPTALLSSVRRHTHAQDCLGSLRSLAQS